MVVIGRGQLGGWQAGGEALQGGGKRGQVEPLEMVQDVPSHAGQTGRERGAAIRAWAGEQGIAVSAPGGASRRMWWRGTKPPRAGADQFGPRSLPNRPASFPGPSPGRIWGHRRGVTQLW